MAKPSITKRTTKGAALTYSELDTNFQNLADATLTLTAGSGGTAVTADLNGNITLVAGTNVTITGDNTAKTITINSSAGGSGTVNSGAATALAHYPSAGTTVDDTSLLYITSLGTVGIQSETSTGGIVVSSTDGGTLYMFDNGNTLLSTGTSTGYLQLQSADGVVLYNPGSTQLFIRTQLSSGDYTGTISIGAKAFSLPLRTTTQRNALSATNGMMIYNTTDNKFQGYANGVWVDLH